MAPQCRFDRFAGFGEFPLWPYRDSVLTPFDHRAPSYKTGSESAEFSRSKKSPTPSDASRFLLCITHPPTVRSANPQILNLNSIPLSFHFAYCLAQNFPSLFHRLSKSSPCSCFSCPHPNGPSKSFRLWVRGYPRRGIRPELHQLRPRQMQMHA